MCLFLFSPRAGHNFAVLPREMLSFDDRSDSYILFLVDSIISCAEAGEHESNARYEKIYSTNGYIPPIVARFSGHQTCRDGCWTVRDAIRKRSRLGSTSLSISMATL